MKADERRIRYTVWRAGRAARRAGWIKERNPYKKYSKLWNEWLQGWKSGRMFLDGV